MTIDNCLHPKGERYFGVVILRDGRRHIAEWCRHCQRNARGTRWLRPDEVPDDPGSLPVIADYRASAPQAGQRGLFEEPS